MARSLTFTIEGDIDTQITVVENIDGTLTFTVEVDESSQQADLRGLFFDVTDEDILGDLIVTGTDVTDSQFNANKVKDLGNGANMNGQHTKKGNGFDAGVEFGTQGIGKDDIDTTSFTLKSTDGPLTLDLLTHMRFGVRLTSVGPEEDRGDSLKIVGTAPAAPDAQDDEFCEDEDTCIAGNVLEDNGNGADDDDDGDTLTVVEVNGENADVGNPIQLANGVLTLNSDGSFEFVPTTSFTGTQTFEYTVSDGDGGQDCAEVTIEVKEVAGETVALSDNIAIDPDSLTLSADDSEVANITRGPDGTVTFDLHVQVPDIPEVADIVLAQDLSGSFSDDISTLQAGNFVADLLSDLTTAGADDVGFGIASFVDYPFSPFGSLLSGDFIYNTDQAVTTNAATADAALDSLSTSYGGDGRESQLVALQQVALRAAGEVGFRADAQRFVVLSTDADYHRAGDYGDGGANDNDTDLTDGSGTGGAEDYPSIAQVATALAAANLTPIFTVTAGVKGIYDSLLAALGVGGSVQILSSDSSNLSDAIIAGLEEATTDVTHQVLSDDHGFVTSVSPASFDDVSGETVTFEVEIEAPQDYADDVVTLNVPGFGSVDLNFEFGPEDIEGTVGRDTYTGNGNANMIDGNERADIIDGAGGDDVLIGGLGNDVVTGGSGSDTFVLEDAAKFRGTDHFTDFDVDFDTIQLSGYGAIGYGDLTISDGVDGAEILVGDGRPDDPIAVVEGVLAAALAADVFDFV